MLFNFCSIEYNRKYNSKKIYNYIIIKRKKKIKRKINEILT